MPITSTDTIGRHWDGEIVPPLVEYIRIPAKSPHFDPAWEKNGYIDRVIQLAHEWARSQPIPGLRLEIVRLPGFSSRARHSPSRPLNSRTGSPALSRMTCRR